MLRKRFTNPRDDVQEEKWQKRGEGGGYRQISGGVRAQTGETTHPFVKKGEEKVAMKERVGDKEFRRSGGG